MECSKFDDVFVTLWKITGRILVWFSSYQYCCIQSNNSELLCGLYVKLLNNGKAIVLI